MLKGERRDPPPIWLMRQAGRYLPEYRALRAEKGGFLDLVYDPAAAAEITLQPLKRFAFDGAILFSDILDRPLRDRPGPELRRRRGPAPDPADGPMRGSAILTRHMRAARTDLRDGAAGEGRACPIDDLPRLRRMPVDGRYLHDRRTGQPRAGRGAQAGLFGPGQVGAILDIVATTTVDYLSRQIEAGVDAVQLFDSWAGSLAPAQFERYVIAPTAWIVDQLRRRHPHPDDRLSQGRGRQASRLCGRNRG